MTTYSTVTPAAADRSRPSRPRSGAAKPGLGAGGDTLRESSRRPGAVVPGAVSDPGAAALAGDRGCGGRGGRRRRHRVPAARWLAGRPDRPTQHHAGRVLGHRRRADRARLGGHDAGDLGGGRRGRADGELFRPAGSAAVADLPAQAADPCLRIALLGGQPRLLRRHGHRRESWPSTGTAPVLDQRGGLGHRGADRLASGPRDPSADADSDPAGTAAGPPARPVDARDGGDPRRLLHDCSCRRSRRSRSSWPATATALRRTARCSR